jgi:hypothetical protein
VACFGQHKILEMKAIDVCIVGGTYSSGFSSGKQEVEAFAGKTVHRLLGLGQRLGFH